MRYLIALLFASQLHASTTKGTFVRFEGADAVTLMRDLALAPNGSKARVRIVGFLTERARPPVDYYDMTINGVKPSLSETEITSLGQMLTGAGIEPSVQAGGTMYLTIDVTVSCTTDANGASCLVM